MIITPRQHNNPDNKNIGFPNKKEQLVKIFQWDKCIYTNKNETITELVDSKYNIIDDNFEEMNSQSNVGSSIKITFTKFKNIWKWRWGYRW